MKYLKIFTSKAPFLRKLLEAMLHENEIVNHGRERGVLQETWVCAQETGKGNPRMTVK